MPHSQECARGVHKTAIGFMRLNKPVSFSPGEEDKEAKLFFTLASCNSEQHLENMTKLSELLMNEGAVEALMLAETPEDLLKIQEDYLD
jgi:PTS system ascorbate-specific IIA component